MASTMEKCCCFEETKRADHRVAVREDVKPEQIRTSTPGIIDHKFVLLAGAKAAMDSDCEPCLKEIVHELEDTGIVEEDIRRAVKNGHLFDSSVELSADMVRYFCESASKDGSGRTGT